MKAKIRLGVTAALALCAGAQTQPANATHPREFPNLDSITAYKLCRDTGGGFFECTAAALYVDPAATNLSSLQLQLAYDTARWVFDAGQSGPLCSFALGGSPCPPVTAAVGMQPLAPLPASAGSTVPGSTLSLSASGGIVSLDYALPNPVSVPSDQNVFVLAFDAVTPFPSDSATATYFNTPGVYEFTQLSASCGDVTCASDTPITGLNLNIGVPEPPTLSLLILSLAALGITTVLRARSG